MPTKVITVPFLPRRIKTGDGRVINKIRGRRIIFEKTQKKDWKRENKAWFWLTTC